MTPPPAPPLYVLVAAAAHRAGVTSCLEEAAGAARRGVPVRVLFTEEGLSVASSPWAVRLHEAGARTLLCGRGARAHRLEPSTFPATVEWSSLTVFLREVPEGSRLWSLFP